MREFAGRVNDMPAASISLSMAVLPLEATSELVSVCVADFETYMRERSPALLRVAYLLTGDPQTAEDVLQTALARVYPRWDRLDHVGGNVHGYVLRTVVNCARAAWRRDRHEGIPVAVVPEATGREWTGDVIDRQLLVGALRDLPMRQRTALVLRYLEDLSETQTAAVMRCSTGSVKTHTSRGLSALRTLLSGTGDVPPVVKRS